MPVRDGERTITPAVTSTLSAMSADDELLVFDDGSRDGTLQKLDDIRDNRIRIVIGGGSSGVASALNRLLSEASHDIVARMDADDIVPPWRFAVQLQALSGATAAVFTTRLNFGTSLKSWRQSIPTPIREGYSPALFLLENPVAHSSMLGSKQIIVKAGGYRTGPAEDYDLWLRLLASGAGISRTATPGLLYRMHAHQVTKSAGWFDRFIQDDLLANAHLDLLRHLGWEGGQCWPLIHRAKNLSPAERDMLAGLHRFYEERLLPGLPLHHRLRQKFLLNRLLVSK
ncbi:glycosyltransferase family 2 protein [Paenarthrobacter nitroguajacolicus]|uniref:glycosyltransferase family 2 protein n=1 Tax=Paenarthrobacter nitroguajacolicus TaxID=211146 RepID=UPI0024993E3C|nr:hypothetical protein [Paenarthrobacter nitroguajacolicus]